MNKQNLTPTIDDYVAFIKHWYENDINIDTATDKEISVLEQLRNSLCTQIGLTYTELNLIAECRIHKLLPNVIQFVRLIIKQQKDRAKLLTNAIN